MRRYFILACFVLLATSGFAQSADEALRYSQLRFGGSARGMAVAGAFGAIGADFSSVINNPAGLALYQKQELMFTFRFEQTKNEALYDGTTSSANRFNFNLGNLGVALVKKKDGNWKNINFGIGYNRLANYSGERFYRSNSTNNSLLKDYKDELSGTAYYDVDYDLHSFESVLAFNTFLLDTLPGEESEYYAATDFADVDQRISVETRGALDELSFSVGGNYNHKLYVGGYIGIPFLFYKERSYHTEISTDPDDVFNRFKMNQTLNTFGVGVNFKMGLIYRPSDWVRVGAAFHTPTYFGVNDDFSSSVTADFDNVTNSDESPIGEFSYNLTTPMRFVGSAGLIIKKYGFLSVDYEWVDYSRARYHTASEFNDFETGLNENIEDFYGSSHVIRIGAEGVLDNVRLRAGYAHYTTPYKNTTALGDFDGSSNYFTGGIGIRLKKVYFDFAYVRGKTKAPNLTVNGEATADETTRNSFILTTGFRF